jgi:hypothetical protein
MSAPAVTEPTVTIGRIEYVIERNGCATNMTDCPNGEHAITVRRVKGCQLTECADVRKVMA